jgi:hypothetical protein
MMSEPAFERLWEEVHRLKNELHELIHEQRKLMSQVTDFTTSVGANISKISTDLDNIAAQIKAGGGALSATDVAALATTQATLAALQAKADAMLVVPTGKVPVITTQPASQTVATGQPATFSVVASDDVPLTYQWFFNGIGGPIGTNSSVLVIPAVTAANAGEYAVVCSNAAGSAVSSNAQLTVA